MRLVVFGWESVSRRNDEEYTNNADDPDDPTPQVDILCPAGVSDGRFF
jgi:hypothetical protein